MEHLIKNKKAYSNDALIRYLLENIGIEDSVLDLGCGPKLYSTPLAEQGSKVLTIDAWAWTDPDIVADLENVDITTLVDKNYDFILMIDFIEHLDKDKGIELIEKCKSITNKKMILLTPLEEIWTENIENVTNETLWCYENTYDLHKSSWKISDFSEWTPIRIKGLKKYFVGYWEK